MHFKLVRSEDRAITPEFAAEFATLPGSPTERELASGRRELS
jgi:hypothetical protein